MKKCCELTEDIVRRFGRLESLIVGDQRLTLDAISFVRRRPGRAFTHHCVFPLGGHRGADGSRLDADHAWSVASTSRLSAGLGLVFAWTLAHNRCGGGLDVLQTVPAGKLFALPVGFRPELVTAHALFLGEHLFTNPMQFTDGRPVLSPVS